MPETPKRIGEISIRRVNSTASERSSSCWPVSSPSPGASSGTIHGASRNAATAASAVAIEIRFKTLAASRHPASSPPRSSVRLKVGMKAADSVAPASTWNTRSGRRNATQYAESSASVPKASAIATDRNSPRSREPRKPNATMPVAPATLVPTPPRKPLRNTRANPGRITRSGAAGGGGSPARPASRDRSSSCCPSDGRRHLAASRRGTLGVRMIDARTRCGQCSGSGGRSWSSATTPGNEAWTHASGRATLSSRE